MSYEIRGTTWSTLKISSREVSRLLSKVHSNYMGKDEFVHDGLVKEYDYRNKKDKVIREATEEEIKVNDAFFTLIDYFYNKED